MWNWDNLIIMLYVIVICILFLFSAVILIWFCRQLKNCFINWHTPTGDLYLSLSAFLGLMRELNSVFYQSPTAILSLGFCSADRFSLLWRIMARMLKSVFPVEDSFSNVWNQYLLFYLSVILNERNRWFSIEIYIINLWKYD